MRIFFLHFGVVIWFLSWSVSAAEPKKAAPGKFVDLVIDLDEFLVYAGPRLKDLKDPTKTKVEFHLGSSEDLTDELKFSFPETNPEAKPRESERYEKDPDVIIADERMWKIATGAREFLLSLSSFEREVEKRGKKLRISYFSARKDAKKRNVELLTNLKVSGQKSALDLSQGRVFSDEKMVPVKGTERRLKDIREILSGVDPVNTLFLDDKVKYVPDDMADGLIWAFESDRHRRLAHVRGVLEAIIGEWNKGASSLHEASAKVQWKGSDKDRRLRDTTEKDMGIISGGIKILRTENPKLDFPSKPDWDSERGPTISSPQFRREEELREANRSTSFLFDVGKRPLPEPSKGKSSHGSSELVPPIVYEQIVSVMNAIIERYPPAKSYYLFRGSNSVWISRFFDVVYPSQTSVLPVIEYDKSVSQSTEVHTQAKYQDFLKEHWPSEKKTAGKEIVLIDFSLRGHGMIPWKTDIEAFLKTSKRHGAPQYLTMMPDTTKMPSLLQEWLRKELRVNTLNLFFRTALAHKMETDFRFRPVKDYSPWDRGPAKFQYSENPKMYEQLKAELEKLYKPKECDLFKKIVRKER